jgi:hypothetical protein
VSKALVTVPETFRQAPGEEARGAAEAARQAAIELKKLDSN